MFGVSVTLNARRSNANVQESKQLRNRYLCSVQIFGIMGAAQIREELHQFINQADERILMLIYGMMKADKEGLLTAEQRDDLDQRIARHKNGESKSYSWPEVRTQIEKRE